MKVSQSHDSHIIQGVRSFSTLIFRDFDWNTVYQQTWDNEIQHESFSPINEITIQHSNTELAQKWIEDAAVAHVMETMDKMQHSIPATCSYHRKPKSLSQCC